MKNYKKEVVFMWEYMKAVCMILMIVFLVHGYHRNVFGVNFAIFFALVYVIIVMEQRRLEKRFCPKSPQIEKNITQNSR